MRAGTEGLHNIAGFAAACKDVDKMLVKSQKTGELKEYFVDELRKLKPGIVINSPDSDKCLPNTVNLSFPGVSNAVFMAYLDYNGIAVSAGSACNTQEDAPSHVLKAIGLTDEQARQSIRFSLSTEITLKNIKYVLNVIDDFLHREKSPINVITPAQLNENLLMDPRTYILDIRFGYDRKILNSLPNSHEAAFVTIHKYIDQIPRDRNILVVCQAGYNSPVVSYYLKSKHFKNVGFLLGGMVAWRLSHHGLYKKLAGQNIEKLKVM